MSLLGLMRGALPGAVAARAGYLHGQDEQRKEDEATKRQTLLDQMKAAMNQSQIEENKSRAKYYEQIGNAKENPDLPVTWKLDGTTGGYTALPTRMRPGAAAGAESKSETTGTTGATGTTGPSEQPKSLLGQMKGDDFGGRTTDFEEGVRAGAGTVPSDAPGTPSTAGTLLSRMKDTPSAVAAVAGVRSDVTAPPKPLKAPPTPKGPTLRRAGVVNPASGNLEDVYSDGSRKVVRVATDAELARANHVPSSGARGAAGPKPLNPKQVEDYLNSVADKAIRATGGDAQKAAEAVLNDPVGRTAYDHGLATRHFLAAKQRFDRQAGIDRDTHDINPDGTPIVTTLPGAKGSPVAPATRTTTSTSGAGTTSKPPTNATGTKKPAGPSGNVDLGGGEAASSTSAASSQRTPEDAATATEALVRSGAITYEHAMSSQFLSDQAKALLRKRLGKTQ
jgi:hypothetical protein